MAQYSSTLLWNIKKLSRYDYSKFQLNNITRSRVIELGIRKLHDDLAKQYCRSRAGTKLFHHIHTLISQHRHFDILADSGTSTCSTINQDNLHSITIKKLDKSKLFHIAHINAQSIRRTVLDFHEYIGNRKVDLCAITESWLKPSDNLESKQIAPPGYSCISHPRSDGRMGGGIAIVFKGHIKVKDVENGQKETMEYGIFTFRIRDTVINMLVIYRLPNTSMITFCNELADVFEDKIQDLTGYVMLTGDFNVHMDKHLDADTRTFNDFLESFGLSNKTRFATHKQGYVLDLVITSNSDQLLDSVSNGHLLSDHHFIHCKLRIGKDDPVLTKSERNIKQLNHTQFDERVCDELNSNVTLTDASLADLVNSYNSTITNILDDLAPITTRALKTSHRQLWYSDKIWQELKLRCWKVKKWLHDPSSYNYNAFFNQCRYVSNLIKTAQRNFFRKAIIDHRTEYKYIFNLANGLLFRNQLSQYPEANSDVELANGFNEFFKTKINKIMDSLRSTDDQIACDRSLLESSS